MEKIKYELNEDEGVEEQTYISKPVNGVVDLISTMTGFVLKLPIKAIGTTTNLTIGATRLTADFIHGLDQILYAALNKIENKDTDYIGTRYDGLVSIGYRCMSEEELGNHLQRMDDAQVLARYADNTQNILQNVAKGKLKALISDQQGDSSIFLTTPSYLEKDFDKEVTFTRKERDNG